MEGGRGTADVARELDVSAATLHAWKGQDGGHFTMPQQYAGEWRCDTHRRFSPDGRKVVIDSPHGGNGRQLYSIDG